MSLNDDAVRVAITGRVYCAPVGTTLPTNVSTALNAAFEDVGYITADALKEKLDVKTEVLRMWQAPNGIRTITTEVNWTFQFQMAETSQTTLGLFYMGAESATVGGVTTTSIPATPGDTAKAWVVEIEDGDVITRIAIPKGDITDRGEVARKGTDGTYYDVTVAVMGTALDDLGYVITNDPEMAAAAS